MSMNRREPFTQSEVFVKWYRKFRPDSKHLEQALETFGAIDVNLPKETQLFFLDGSKATLRVVNEVFHG